MIIILGMSTVFDCKRHGCGFESLSGEFIIFIYEIKKLRPVVAQRHEV